MFALEALCALMPIPDVSVSGVPEWFGTCMEMKIKGNGGPEDGLHSVWVSFVVNATCVLSEIRCLGVWIGFGGSQDVMRIRYYSVDSVYYSNINSVNKIIDTEQIR